MVYFNTNEHYRQAVEMQTRDRFILKTKAQYPAHSMLKVPQSCSDCALLSIRWRLD
jgi:hypothetical protein